MATNYPAGHLWDKLDAKACIRGALEIEALHTSHGQACPNIDDLCTKIKAADDAAADRDYMLDSNDCIAVLRGEWKAPLVMDKPERPSHGQAPAQAAPAAVAGPSISQVTEQMRAAGDHAWMTSDGVDSARVFWAMLAAAPTTQPAPHPVDEFQPCPSCFGKGVEGDADDYGRTIDVTCGECNGSGRAQATTQPAPQQEAQEPVGYTHASWIAEAKRGGGGSFVGRKNAAFDVPIYTAPQPSPAAKGDELDAARYRWLRDKNNPLEQFDYGRMHPNGTSCYHMVGGVRELKSGEELDCAIDAARAAQEGKSHG